MKHFFASFLFITLFYFSHSQVTQGIWLTGGTGTLLSTNYSWVSPTFSYSSDKVDIKISANLGYFIKDKIALGLRPSFSKYKEVAEGTGGNINSNVNRLEIGPFVRYYFLEAEKQFNILGDIGYQYGFYWFKPTRGNINTVSANAGTVVFFNTSVGLELLLGYYHRKEVIKENEEFVTNQKGFQISIGFAIHLEK